MTAAVLACGDASLSLGFLITLGEASRCELAGAGGAKRGSMNARIKKLQNLENCNKVQYSETNKSHLTALKTGTKLENTQRVLQNKMLI